MDEQEKLTVQEFNNTPYFSHKTYAYKVTALIIILYIISGIILSIFQSAFLNDEQGKIFSIYSQGFLQLVIILLPTLYFARRALLPFDILIRKKNSISIKQVVAGIMGIIAFQMFATGYMVIQERIIPDMLLPYYYEMEQLIEDLYISLLGGSGTFDLTRAMIIGALIPAVSEETLFRGFLQTSLEQEMPAVKAIIITSLIFSILHLNPIGFLPLLCIGVYLGFTAWASRSLVLPVIIHFTNNAIAVIVIFSPQLNEIEEKTSELPLSNAIFLFVGGLIIVIASCYVIYKDTPGNNNLKELHLIEK
ncbi:lysostaphin resistance A-like protein [Bacteroidota bacterium]